MRELSPLSCQDPQLSCPVPSQPWVALWVFWHCTVGSKIISFSFCLELAALLPPTTTIAVLSKRNLLLSFHVSSALVVREQSALWLLLSQNSSLLSGGQLFTWRESCLQPSLFCLAPESTSPSIVCLLLLKVLFEHYLKPSCCGLLDHSPGFSFVELHPHSGYHRGLVFTVPTKPSGWARWLWWITAPWLSQPFGTWDACGGVQQLVSTWAVLWWTELGSLLLSRNLLWSSCHSLGCVCIHCKVVWCFQLARKMACVRTYFPLMPTDSHCSEQNKIWRMCLGSARTW